MKKSKYQRRLTRLLKKPVFTTKDARSIGISSRMLFYFCQKGIILRLGRGIYQSLDVENEINFDLEGLVLTSLTIPKGVICLISALCYYHLTDQIMREYWIAVPNSQRAPKRLHARIIRMRNMSLGLTTVKMGKYKVRIFDRERTVIDAFRYLSDEIAIKALKEYLKPSKVKADLAKLYKYSKALRMNLGPYVMVLTT